MKKEDRMRDIYRRSEAKRLLANLSPDQIEEMAIIAKTYFDLRQAVPSQHSIEVFNRAFNSLDYHLVDKERYFIMNKKSGNPKLSTLRLEAAARLSDGVYGGINRIRPSRSELVYPMPNAVRVSLPEKLELESTSVPPEESTPEGYLQAYERSLLND